MKLRSILIGPLLIAGLSVQAQAPTVPAATSQAAEPFAPEISLTAPIAYMLDLGSGRVLFEREANRRFMPASLTKIMTAYVAFEMLADGRIHPNQRFIFGDAAFDQWRGIGSRWRGQPEAWSTRTGPTAASCWRSNTTAMTCAKPQLR